MNKVFKIITTITIEQNDALVESYTPEQLDLVKDLSDSIESSDEYAFVNKDGHIIEYIITNDEVMDRVKSFGEEIGAPIQAVDVTELVGEATEVALKQFLNNGQGII
jgi:hypothetical protein